MSRTKSMLALAAGSVFAGTAAQASVTPLPNLVQVAVPSGTGTYVQQGSPSAGGTAGGLGLHLTLPVIDPDGNNIEAGIRG